MAKAEKGSGISEEERRRKEEVEEVEGFSFTAPPQSITYAEEIELPIDVNATGLGQWGVKPFLFFHFRIKATTDSNAAGFTDTALSSPQNIKNRFWQDIVERLGKQEGTKSQMIQTFTYESYVRENFPRILKAEILSKLNKRYAPFYFEVKKMEYGSLDLVLDVVNASSLVKTSGLTVDVLTGFLEMFAPIALVRSINYGDASADALDVDIVISDELKIMLAKQQAAVPKSKEQVKKEPLGILKGLDKTLLLARASWIIPILLAFLIWNSYRQEQYQIRTMYMNKYDSTYGMQYELLRLQKEIITDLSNQNSTLKDSLK